MTIMKSTPQLRHGSPDSGLVHLSFYRHHLTPHGTKPREAKVPADWAGQEIGGLGALIGVEVGREGTPPANPNPVLSSTVLVTAFSPARAAQQSLPPASPPRPQPCSIMYNS